MSNIFATKSVVLTKSLTLGILFSMVLRAKVAAKLVILGILTSISMILALQIFFF